jgi:isopentenyldiphosphate isomerase
MELIDILDAQGNKTGRVKPKAEVHRDGDWHRAVHVWILGPGDQVLLQRRSKNKENNPGKWDVSVAGHLSAGEGSVQAALREIKEEIGLILASNDLSYQFTVTEEQILNDGRYIDREFHDVYFARKADDVAVHVDPVNLCQCSRGAVV